VQGRCPCRSARCLRTNSFSFILRRLWRRKIKLTLGVLVTLLRVMRRFEHGEYIFCSAYRNRSSRTLGTLFDGIARHTQDGFNSVSRAKEAGFRQAVRERDDPLGDYGSGPSSRRKKRERLSLSLSTRPAGHTHVSPSTPLRSAAVSPGNLYSVSIPSRSAPAPAQWSCWDDKTVATLLRFVYRR
jgi:hypothetical protein